MPVPVLPSQCLKMSVRIRLRHHQTLNALKPAPKKIKTRSSCMPANSGIAYFDDEKVMMIKVHMMPNSRSRTKCKVNAVKAKTMLVVMQT